MNLAEPFPVALTGLAFALCVAPAQAQSHAWTFEASAGDLGEFSSVAGPSRFTFGEPLLGDLVGVTVEPGS